MEAQLEATKNNLIYGGIELTNQQEMTAEAFSVEDMDAMDYTVRPTVCETQTEKKSKYLRLFYKENGVQKMTSVFLSEALSKKAVVGQDLKKADVCFYYITTEKDGTPLEGQLDEVTGYTKNPYFIAGKVNGGVATWK